MRRFISQFGMHAAPIRETLRRAIPEDQLYHHSPSMDHHNKDDPKNKGDDLMLTVTGLPTDLDDHVDFSMISQAEGLKFALEHFRRRKPHCSGTLLWQLNDCWPVLSWSVIDYNGFGKAGYYYVRRAYSPLLASFEALPDGSVELWRSDHDRFPYNRHFFVAIKDLRRDPVEPEVDITSTASHELRVHLEAPAYAYFVNLEVPDEATRFSDNYFDIEPKQQRTISITNEKKVLTAENVKIRWR